MQVVWENNNEEQKLLEEKRKKMNELIGLNNISIKENITLLINGWCAEHIKRLHKEYPNTEWLAVCKVEPQGNWVFLMTDMVFPWQKGVGADVETSEEWMKWLNKELLDRWENAKLWNCILHSHHHMWVFWSGTDDNARLWMNDWRQVERAVVTAYDKEWNIDYKGCVNFYKPYNIEIDVDVRNEEWETVVEKYDSYLTRVAESETAFYEFLLDNNKDYIDSITETPSYSKITDYLWIDITEDLKKNYNELNDKIWNPELLDYLHQLNELAHQLALSEVNNGWAYWDMLAEYGAFCDWSEDLLTQLEENRKSKVECKERNTFTSQTTYPINRYLEDDYSIYEITDKYSESQVRQMFWLDYTIPLKLWDSREWLIRDDYVWEYVYIEDRAEEYWDMYYRYHY